MSMCASASPKITEKKINGRSAPSAAALMRFAGTRSTIQLATVGATDKGAEPCVPEALAVRSARAADCWMETPASRRRAITSVPVAVAASSKTEVTKALAPTRPSPLDACDAVDPPRLATTVAISSGMTVIRIRLTKIVPTGASTAAAC
jgi:hypothetical protein